MNIPIVQGTEVPSGGEVAQAHPTTSYATYDNAGSDFKPQIQEQQHQQPQFRDGIWAVLFVVHLVAIIVIISLNISNMEVGIGDTYNGVIWLVGVTGVTSIGVGSAALSLMMRYATELVKISLVATVIMGGIVGVLGIMSGQMMMGVMGLLMFAVGICYARAVWPRIPFAAANLNTALTAVRCNMGLTVIAYFMLFLAFGWSIMWFIGLGEALSSSNGIVLFLLFLSYYWVHQVLTNTVHVTTAGTIGTWWFVPGEANACWSTAIQDSFCRATTYSFGSICLGSLLVAIVQALRALVHLSRENEEMQMVTCILECILGCIEDIIEYMNKWAYIYVGKLISSIGCFPTVL